MAPFLREMRTPLSEATGAEVEIVEVRNKYFGESVTIAGLLGGQDILSALEEGREGDIVVLPAESLNADEVFIDNVPFSELVSSLSPAQVFTGYEVTAALGAL
jgi:NifB/MoaA-like Fe-S oxidoreductase